MRSNAHSISESYGTNPLHILTTGKIVTHPVPFTTITTPYRSQSVLKMDSPQEGTGREQTGADVRKQ